MSEEIEGTLDRRVELTASVVSAYVSHNPIPSTDLPSLINQIYAALVSAGGSAREVKPEVLRPAVPIRKSVTPDYIISLEDGKKFKSLKRHLMSRYGMTPEDYRAKWGLPADYPMVAPNYAAARSTLAKFTGLGRKPKGSKRPARAKRG